jgi:CBS-domain-containing membrane protein
MGVPIVHGFPIVDEDGKITGLISRESLMILVDNKVWIERDLNSKFNSND